MKVFYTCNGCHYEGAVVVPARETVNNSIQEWMDHVSRVVQLDHTYQRPRCKENKVDLKIPLSNEEGAWIGKEVEPVKEDK